MNWGSVISHADYARGQVVYNSVSPKVKTEKLRTELQALELTRNLQVSFFILFFFKWEKEKTEFLGHDLKTSLHQHMVWADGRQTRTSFKWLTIMKTHDCKNSYNPLQLQ